MKNIVSILFMTLCVCCGLKAQEAKSIIGLAGNAYVTSEPKGARITEKGVVGWSDAKSTVAIYFHLSEPGEMELALNASGNATIEVSCGKQKKRVELRSKEYAPVSVGTFKVTQPGYVQIQLKGVKKEGPNFGDVKELIVSGIKGKLSYVTGFSDYWGRRGPSVHLGYTLPKEPVEWFYTEVKVPKAGEVMHSYYMAAGFGEGYFGMQYNSESERRILFSVWSPFDTQDPKQIPDEDKIRLLKRGKGVHIGEFGNEGSGGQSYMLYPWKAEETYRFLMRVRPDGKGNTAYTAYFFATEEKAWKLVASFLRPKTDTWYTHPHSFLENFSPTQGYLTRRVQFANQWALTKEGVWKELTKARFTNDATAQARVRLDFEGGYTKESNAFYLRMGGFFNESTNAGTQFDRTPEGKQPQIDIKALEEMTE